MSEYIMDLRKIVGHRPLLQAGSSVIVEVPMVVSCSNCGALTIAGAMPVALWNWMNRLRMRPKENFWRKPDC